MKKCLILGLVANTSPLQENEAHEAALREKIRRILLEIYQNGCGMFLTGLRPGLDLWVAEMIAEMKPSYRGMEMCYLFANAKSRCGWLDTAHSAAVQCEHWWNLRLSSGGLERILEKESPVSPDLVFVLSDDYTSRRGGKKNALMLNAVRRADKPVICLNPKTLDVVYEGFAGTIWTIPGKEPEKRTERQEYIVRAVRPVNRWNYVPSAFRPCRRYYYRKKMRGKFAGKKKKYHAFIFP